ncbi:MAG: alkaline phosphatase family protein [Polyangia bacterium]
MKRLLLAGLLCCGVARAGKAPKRPKLVVTAVVDQLGAWVLSDRLQYLSPQGGFARLLREGTYVREMDYAHAATETAPGHASLYTGAPPRDNGIVSNERFVPSTTGAVPLRVPALLDDSTHEITSKGPSNKPSVSLIDLRAEPLADRLRADKPLSQVISLSLKDRGVVFAGGHQPRVAIWYDVHTDDIVTSSAFMKAMPAWAKTTFESSLSLRGPLWTTAIPAGTLPAWVVDDRPGEGSFDDEKPVFPHRIASAASFRASPFADRFLFDMAIAALDDLGRGTDGPTLLAISLSSNDYVSHVYGSDSLEAYEELYALDRSLAQFMSNLDDRYGKDGWALELAADHGSTPLPETVLGARPWCAKGAKPDRWERPCATGHRVDQPTLSVVLEKATQKALGKEHLVTGVADPYVYFSDAAQDPQLRARVVSVVTAVLRATPGVAEVFDTTKLPKKCPPVTDESMAALVCRSTSSPDTTGRGRSGDLYVVLDPGSFFDSGISHGKGGSHGTPYRFNRAVPLLVRAPGLVPAGVVEETPLMFSSFVRTAAGLLGIKPPKNAVPGTNLSK